jgi:hypothetical protein
LKRIRGLLLGFRARPDGRVKPLTTVILPYFTLNKDKRCKIKFSATYTDFKGSMSLLSEWTIPDLGFWF